MWIQSQLDPQQALVSLDDSLRESLELASEGVAFLGIVLGAWLFLGEHNAVQHGSNAYEHNQEGA